MKHKILSLVLMAVVVVFFAGCSAVETSSSFNQQDILKSHGNAVAHINADCFGYYLFNCIPLIAGDPNKELNYKLFTDTIKVNNVVAMLNTKANKLGATRVIDVQTIVPETSWLILFSFGIIWYKEVQASGTAIK